jgi:hypothetical protein
MTAGEVAEMVFRRSEAWFIANKPQGFPEMKGGLYAREAVVEWVRREFGLAMAPVDAQDVRSTLLGRLKNGAGSRQVPRRAKAAK